MKAFINHWHFVSVYLAGAAALIPLFVALSPVQTCLLVAIIMFFLHFFEEFGFPGGFPLMGVKVMLASDERDKTKWGCNNLNSMFGNWGFLFLVYILPFLLPSIQFLTLSAMLFLLAEVAMHLIIFPLKLKAVYNAGLVTGVFGMGAVAFYYFTTLFQAQLLTWLDYVLAVAWFVFAFFLCFRSKLYWKLGKAHGYDLTDRTAYGLD